MPIHLAGSSDRLKTTGVRIACISALIGLGITTLGLGLACTTRSLALLAGTLASGLSLLAGLTLWAGLHNWSLSCHHGRAPGRLSRGSLWLLGGLFLVLLGSIGVALLAIGRLRLPSGVTEAKPEVLLLAASAAAAAGFAWDVLARAASALDSSLLLWAARRFRGGFFAGLVTLSGLMCTQFAQDHSPDAVWIEADPIAALLVAVYVAAAGVRIAAGTASGVAQRGADDLGRRIERAACASPGILRCPDVRLHALGPGLLADVHVVLAGRTSLAEAARLTEVAADVIRRRVPMTDVVVRAIPAGGTA